MSHIAESFLEITELYNFGNNVSLTIKIDFKCLLFNYKWRKKTALLVQSDFITKT